MHNQNDQLPNTPVGRRLRQLFAEHETMLATGDDERAIAIERELLALADAATRRESVGQTD